MHMPELTIHHRHTWDLPPGEARKVQDDLRRFVVEKSLSEDEICLVAGVDAAFLKDSIVAAAVVLDYDDLRVIDSAVVRSELNYPYVPGLLSFREAPAILDALAQRSVLPDVLIVDGHGIAHPRRFGLACHLGVLLDLPSIGCGKSILVGEAREPGLSRSDRTALIDSGTKIGIVLRTRDNVRPVYISVGHRMDLASAASIVLKCTAGYRLPEPTRQADKLAARAKRDCISAVAS
jgi:deoxyribonuclease V